MTTYPEFYDWLFPGDELGPQRNPDVPAAVVPLLEEVQCKTGVPLDWLEKTSQFVINGLAGAQCLWFLHGAKGTLVEEPRTDEIGIPTRHDELSHDLALELMDLYAAHQSTKRGLATVDGTYFEWADGYLIEVAPPNKKSRRLKLGKWLRKMGASEGLRKAFETRKLGHWDWEVSAHPYDVLTMSFRRPWTSCMRPPDPEGGKEAGEAQYGPLTDLAAGSAILFFSRPGAGQPCGRLMLRPAMAHYGIDPMIIVSGHRVYGCGPDVVPVGQLQQMLAPFLPSRPSAVDVTSQEPYLCSLGADGRALSRYIYSDTDHNFCQQSDEEYDKAYTALVDAPWPEPKLLMESSWSIAAEFQGEIDTSELDLEDDEVEIDIQQLAANAHDLAIEENAWDDILDALRDPTFDIIIPDAIVHSLPNNTPDYIYDDLREPVANLLEGSLIEAANEHTTQVYAFEAGTSLDPIFNLVEEYAGYSQTPEYIGDAVLHELGMSPNAERTAYFTDDGEEVETVLFISSIFNPNLSGVSRHVVADGEIDGSNWTEYIIRVLDD